MANSSFLRKPSSSNSDLTLGFVLRQENIQYRAEGNSSLVVRLIKENWILRISKIDVQDHKPVTVASSSQCFNAVEEEMRKSFAQDVLKLLLGDAFIPNMKIVHLTKEETKSVISAVEKQRPAFRMHKGLSEFPAGSYALLMPDLCTSLLSDKRTLSKDLPKGPKISVEIKPKQGFLDVSEYFLNEIDETLVNNFFVCKFCLKQFLKVKEGPYTVQSNFCPLDLFSGCDSRMKHSLKELLKNPQNNLRIFKDGKLIFGGEKLTCHLNDLWHYTDLDNAKMMEKKHIKFDEEDFISILIKALKWSPNEQKVLPLPSPKYSNEASEKSKIKFQRCQYSQDCIEEICDSVKENDNRHKLAPGCVLDSILRVQTLGDSCLKTVLPYFTHCNNELLRLQLSNYFESISPNFIYPSSKIPEYVGETEQNPNETDWKFYTRKIWEYLVSLTAKDCSIIITLQPLFEKLENNYEEHILHCRNQDFLMEVKVVDLDPKPLYKIQKNYEGNKKLVFFASTNIT